MNLGTGGATALVGGVAVVVTAWGAWFSSTAARMGPGWAKGHLFRWRAAPWILGLAGVGIGIAFEPIWVGFGVIYIAAVTGFLMWQVRRRLHAVEQAYGPYDEDLTPSRGPRRVGSYLLGGGVLLALLAAIDVLSRGWNGVFTLALAALLMVAGWVVRRA